MILLSNQFHCQRDDQHYSGGTIARLRGLKGETLFGRVVARMMNGRQLAPAKCYCMVTSVEPCQLNSHPQTVYQALIK